MSQIHLMQLYAEDMNVYGDNGNVLTLKRRLEWHGYEVKLTHYNQGDTFPEDVDLIVGGGGQDSGQNKVQADLTEIGPRLIELANQGVPMLMICGLYQLFGKSFTTSTGEVINGIGLFDLVTKAGNERLIGNIVINSPEFGQIVGFENHSGQTYLGDNSAALGTIARGAGNNGQDETEGARYKNVIGSYLHGPILPKNPQLADWLIEQADVRRYGDFTPTVTDDRFADTAHKVAAKRPP